MTNATFDRANNILQALTVLYSMVETLKNSEALAFTSGDSGRVSIVYRISQISNINVKDEVIGMNFAGANDTIRRSNVSGSVSEDVLHTCNFVMDFEEAFIQAKQAWLQILNKKIETLEKEFESL